jgi:hypothetical protein
VSAATLLWSLLSAAVFLGAGLVVADAVRRRWFASSGISLSVTVVALVWLCWALVLGQLLGAVGLLRPLPLVLAALVTAGAALWAASRPTKPATTEPAANPTMPATTQPAADPTEPATTEPATEASPAAPAPYAVRPGWQDQALTVATVVLVAVVAALWLARTVIALHGGIDDPDSLGYHLPLMATFAHTGYADQHRLLIPLYPVQFYPANDELLSAVALVLTRSVAFAALKNLVFGGLLLAAAHALGSAYRRGRVAVAATAVVLGLPVIAFSQAGEAVNDTLMLLALLGGLALLAHARDRPAPYLLALACAGVALGVKFSAIVPAAALAGLAVVLLVSRVAAHRWRWTAAGLALSALTGGSWYLRNAITYGNPVPPVRVALGPLHLRTIDSYEGRFSFSVGHYLVRDQYLGIFQHGLGHALGAVGVVICVAGLLGALLLMGRGDGFARGLSVFVAASLIGYLTTPAGAAGVRKQIPYAFVVNLHYAAPAVLVAVVAAAVLIVPEQWAWIVPVVGAVAVLTSIGTGQKIAVWAPQIGGGDFSLLLVAAGVAGVGAVVWLLPGGRRWALVAAGLAALLAVIGAATIARTVRSRRATDAVDHWAASVPTSTIGAWVGNIADLYGPHARNRVTVLARTVDGGAVPIDSCQSWKEAVIAGGYQYTAVIAGSAWANWSNADPAFRRVAHDLATTVYQVVGTPDLACPGQTNFGADFWLAPGYGI